ncbi:hypothetical protein CKQ80_23835 [Pseudomonas moraviensis]|uniref:Phage-like protein n=1 Tax=Pseudomonas moraviensis TaxID=321662 RepID=A0A2A2PSL7_9PSED|nr:hypothetical protein [Pseudomonas moraviensis]PAW51664.1 hypothetical protein CKQ68_05375 [Pseudomonas moraviensis]PAW58211.1 hypothetical protein CKQ80_23835 [Pseudomonas moraviensis]
MAMSKSAVPDWESIERAYRAGSLSVRAIADQHDLTDGAIRKRAKKEGWTRDLTEKVKKATKDKLLRAEVRTDGTQDAVARTDDEIVAEASDAATAVVLSHRTGLAKWRKIADKLCDTLNDMDVVAENLGDFSRALNAGVDAQLKVIKGERQAYNLDTEEGDKTVDTLAAMMDELSKDA